MTIRSSTVKLALAFGIGATGLVGCASHGSEPPARAATNGVIGVNGYLWRATLDTLSFMPLLSADPFGGVVNTDWYINPDRPNERFKATVYILDSRLRADGVTVTIFRQISDGQGGWTPAPTADQTAVDIENAILTRARQLRLANLRG